MHPLHSRQDIAWEMWPHLPSAPLARGRTREHTLAPSSAAGQDWKHRRVDGADAGGFLQLIPPMPEWEHPALVEASEPGKEMRRR